MTRLVLRIFDYFSMHRGRMLLVLLLTVPLLCMLVSRIHFKEDISDFLPLGSRNQEAMAIYRQLSGADRILVLVGGKDDAKTDPDSIVQAVDDFVEAVRKHTNLKADAISSQVDMDRMARAASFVYDNVPYFLTHDDYASMERKLRSRHFIKDQLALDKQLLLLPSGSFLSDNMGRDPLHLFTPVVRKLSSQTSQLGYELYDDHIFMPDMKRALVMITSPYGSSETEHNYALVGQLEKIVAQTEHDHAAISVRLTGGPVIAVGNAQRIKADSTVSVTIAVVLILLILVVSFRNAWNIALIAVSIAWGWLFALAGLSAINSNMSVIVVGISSVILGIAINYPLHLIAHLSHTSDVRKALREILMPLLIGNITTIGAFLALVPLKSVALRDLGLFASFLLMGTILFVLVFLPHIVRHTQPQQRVFLGKLGAWRPDRYPKLIVAIAVLTVIFAVFSFRVGFDANLSHMNYMSAEQRHDLDYLVRQRKNAAKDKEIYIVSSGKTLDAALSADDAIQGQLARLCKAGASVSGVGQFLCSRREQRERLKAWQSFIGKYGKQIAAALSVEASRQGFTAESFSKFKAILSRDYPLRAPSYFKTWQEAVLPNGIVYDKVMATYNIVSVVSLPKTGTSNALAQIGRHIDDASHYHFEIGQLNSVIANSLSDNFNYIGYACGLIVFFFLWFSFGNIELAALSFLPMAVSWVWILGIMGLTGTEFNIVNIILATFIFGQGDDYTIFMTEGCQYEYAYGRKMLASYKHSILLSALIMFIGMGALIIARHPALHSLAVVTVIGMFSVVLMAWILPPFIFRWLVSKRGVLRNRPLTLKSLIFPKRYPQVCSPGEAMEYYISYVKDAYYYCGSDVVRTVRQSLRHYSALVHADTVGQLSVDAGSYGAVALAAALMYPNKTIMAEVDNEDDAAVCRQIACRIAKNIKVEKQPQS